MILKAGHGANSEKNRCADFVFEKLPSMEKYDLLEMSSRQCFGVFQTFKQASDGS